MNRTPFHIRKMESKFFAELLKSVIKRIKECSANYSTLPKVGDLIQVFEQNEWALLTGQYAIIKVISIERSLENILIEYELLDVGEMKDDL